MYSPQDLDFPAKFDSFRDCQQEAFDFCLTSQKQFVALGMPPGSGKSGVAYGLAKLFGGQTIILTATHGLEDQYRGDFNNGSETRIAHIRGRRNYTCWEGGNCDDGRRMGCSDKLGCLYLSAYRLFDSAEISLTNYAWWLAANQQNQGLAKPDTLICDEAHLTVEWLANSLNFWITERELRQLGKRGRSGCSEDIEDWVALAPGLLEKAFQHHEQAKQGLTGKRFRSTDDAITIRRAEELYDKINKLSRIGWDKNNWIVTAVEGDDVGRLWRFEVIWPGLYKQRLFQSVARVILMSATLRPKTINLLGLKRDEVEFKEWGRQFPAINGPVVWVPTVSMKHGMSNEDTKRWIDRHDEIFEWGSDRNGLSHTVSYDRAKQLDASLGGRHRIVLNGAADPESSTAQDAFKRFTGSTKPSVLVSPSFAVGWDFSGTHAEWQVISKIAFPPRNSKIIQARTDSDPDYPAYVAAQDLVQACGRITRYPQDRGTTLIVDDTVSKPWFKHALKEHAPRWFNVRKEEQLPRPLEKI